ncbi:MAG: DUF4430 domain-containing protein [Oscillospiraceae bacterium]|nr:DUF4430 domain-containing protein [Oscillospiraceae bacterium]
MKKKILIIVAAVLVVALMLGAYFLFREKATQGEKAITITVIDSTGKETVYELNTDALYLIQAMDEAEGLTYEGEDGPYGMMISHINGERAVYEEDGAYWSFNVNGDYCNYGISEQPVNDGDAFEIVYTPA